MRRRPRRRAVHLLVGVCLGGPTLLEAARADAADSAPTTTNLADEREEARRNGSRPMLAPGAPGVDGRRIVPYTNQLDMIEVRPEGTERFVGTWDDRVEVEERNGVPILRRIQHSRVGDRTSVHLDEVDRRTLQPLRARYESDGKVVADATYHGRRLEAREITTPKGMPATERIPITLSIEFQSPVFDWHLWGGLLSSFPLADGYAGAFLAHTTADSEGPLLRHFTFEVAGRETVDLGARGRIECYVVRVDAGQPWTFWISVTRRPVPVVQLKIASPDGVVWWWRPPHRPAP